MRSGSNLYRLSSLILHSLQDGRDDHFPPAVGRPPRLLQSIAKELFVPYKDVADVIEDGRILQGIEQRLERRAIGEFVECQDDGLLHVRVGVFQGAVQRRQGTAVAAEANGGRGRGTDTPVV